MLSRKFLERVRTERTVETRKYRYIWDADSGIIVRKPLVELDTTSEWQPVASYRLGGGNADANRNNFSQH